ncbi:hypothetical protein GGG16DRAFT_104317 [Schizophyllum commune]
MTSSLPAYHALDLGMPLVRMRWRFKGGSEGSDSRRTCIAPTYIVSAAILGILVKLRRLRIKRTQEIIILKPHDRPRRALAGFTIRPGRYPRPDKRLPRETTALTPNFVAFPALRPRGLCGVASWAAVLLGEHMQEPIGSPAMGCKACMSYNDISSHSMMIEGSGSLALVLVVFDLLYAANLSASGTAHSCARKGVGALSNGDLVLSVLALIVYCFILCAGDAYSEDLSNVPIVVSVAAMYRSRWIGTVDAARRLSVEDVDIVLDLGSDISTTGRASSAACSLATALCGVLVGFSGGQPWASTFDGLGGHSGGDEANHESLSLSAG